MMMMMMSFNTLSFAAVVALVVVVLFPKGQYAFHPVVPQSRRMKGRIITSIAFGGAVNNNNESDNIYHQDHFQRAIECAQQEGLCGTYELLELAQELKEFDACLFVYEDDDENQLSSSNQDTVYTTEEDVCERQEMDRLDLADLLQTEGELRIRRDTVTFANSFKEQVEKQQQTIEEEQ